MPGPNISPDDEKFPGQEAYEGWVEAERERIKERIDKRFDELVNEYDYVLLHDTPDCKMCGEPNRTAFVYSERRDERRVLCAECLLLMPIGEFE